MAKELPQGVVNIRGKEYQTVALRVHTFRESFKNASLITEVLHRDLDCVVMKATVLDESGRVLATGHAEEYRKASDINRTSALENCETSAIGRALASLGIGGTEFASADEVARAISGAKGEPIKKAFAAPHKPTDGIDEAISDDKKAELDELALYMIDCHAQGKELDAIRVYYEIPENDEKIYVWKQLAAESKLRALIKANSPHNKEAA